MLPAGSPGFLPPEIGRPSEKETLTSRFIDRPLRPLFPKGLKNEIQIVATVLSGDMEIDPDIVALNGAAAALEISDCPFQGPWPRCGSARSTANW